MDGPDIRSLYIRYPAGYQLQWPDRYLRPDILHTTIRLKHGTVKLDGPDIRSFYIRNPAGYQLQWPDRYLRPDILQTTIRLKHTVQLHGMDRISGLIYPVSNWISNSAYGRIFYTLHSHHSYGTFTWDWSDIRPYLSGIRLNIKFCLRPDILYTTQPPRHGRITRNGPDFRPFYISGRISKAGHDTNYADTTTWHSYEGSENCKW